MGRYDSYLPEQPDSIPITAATNEQKSQKPKRIKSRTLADCEHDRIVTNADLDADKEPTIPRPMAAILADVSRLAGNWPRRVGRALFVPDPAGVSWLGTTESLFGWLGSTTGRPSVFRSGAGFHSRAEVFNELTRTAQSYDAVESLIHEPPMPGHYYASETITEAGSGERLRWLIERFSPATDIDRDLILSLLMTCIWGGPPGTRPAFVVTADAGRGSGKSKLISLVSEVVGGHIEISSQEEAGSIRQRLLSPDGLGKRLAVLDNVKSHKFSWAELESLITSSIISGKRMYVGEAQRPNTLVWAITLNGVSLSTDLAQRSVIIKLAKPAFDPLWEEQTRAYIREHRAELIADIVGAIRGPRFTLTKYSRWNAWERDILARLPEPSEAQAVIAERQHAADVETDEAAIIEDMFRWKLKELRYDPDADRVFIPSGIARKWLIEATNENQSTTGATRRLKQMIDEGVFSQLIVAPSNNHGRGFHWIGLDTEDHRCLADIEQRIGIYQSNSRREF